MKINSISGNYNRIKNNRTQSFGHAYVGLTKQNLASVIAKNVDLYNATDFRKMYNESAEIASNVISNILKTSNSKEARIKSVNDLVNKVDLFVLAGGSGSRFKELATLVASLRGKQESFNKISLPFDLKNGQAPLTMLDIPLAMGRFFADKNGYKTLISEKPTGSFGDVIKHYLYTKKAPKDVVVCCGDNVFDNKGEEMLDFVVKTINNQEKQLGIIGVKRTPSEVAKRFGVLNLGVQNPTTKYYPLEGFVEKPELETAKKLVTNEGFNVANTGMFVIKKESMEKLLKILRYEHKILDGKTTYIAKDPIKEIYDFAAATKWTRDINGANACDVKIVDVWEDVGEPQAYLSWMKQLKDGYFLKNFTPERRKLILDEVKKRVNDNSIQFSLKPSSVSKISDINVIA